MRVNYAKVISDKTQLIALLKQLYSNFDHKLITLHDGYWWYNGDKLGDNLSKSIRMLKSKIKSTQN